MNWRVGDVVRPADGSGGRYIIEAITETRVHYRDMATNQVRDRDRFGFFCRYCTLDEYDRKGLV